MASLIVKICNLLILVAGLAVVYFCQKANPAIFHAGGHSFVQVWLIIIFAFFAVSAVNKTLIIFNKILPILSLGSIILFGMFAICFFAPLFIDIPKTDSSHTGLVLVTMVGWLLWDIFLLTIHVHSIYNKNIFPNQR